MRKTSKAAVVLHPHELRRVAVMAECDPRTVRRFLRGAPIRYMVEQRIRRALAALVQPDELDAIFPETVKDR